MTRTRAEALVLVNWNGIFYERFLLDRHVTALEGVNGAGKTTVMIAAYVVLLPDMSRLRFTNLGETGATGGDRGIWGRLGEPGRPSYAAIDFTLPGSGRLVAGVHLERKGEPSVEPTPFIVTELDASVRLQELMLTPEGDRESVPELPELRKNAARLGGRLHVFTTAREYFLALFEHGVTPLRLGTDEERGKLNEMLRTSMTGGISRALTSELRTFLLKEESNLAGTLQRMRANLDACRRTRTEVIESQRLEREIGGVFEAGQAMFAAALLATRARAEEFAHRVEVAEAEQEAARAALREAEDALALILSEIEALEARRGEGEAGLERTQALLARTREALAAADEVSRRRRELEEAEAVERAAAQRRAAAKALREADRIAVQRARETQKHAAAGLADLSRGIDELYRRAGAHRQTVRRRAEAESLLEIPGLPTDGIAARIDGVRSLLAEADIERRDRERDLADAESHREAYEKGRAALRLILSGDVPDAEVHGAALGALRGLRDLRSLAGRIPDLARDLAEARALAARQADVRERARGLGVPPGEGPAAERVRALLEAAESERSRLEGQLRDAQSSFADAKRALADLGTQRRVHLELAPRWRDLTARAERLGAFLGGAVPDRPALDQARSLLADRLAAAKAREEALAGERESLLAEADRLFAAGGPFDPDLLLLRDRLGADLLAAGFEDVPLSEAARIEARLGPLAQALLVGDPRAAARAIADRPDSLPTVWLIGGETGAAAPPDEDPGSHEGSRDVHVLEGPALRVSRIPERPCLGRTARETRVAELRAEADFRDRERDEVAAARRELGRLVEDGEALLEGQEIWRAGDPGPRIAELDRQLLETDPRAALLRDAAARSGEAARRLGPMIDG
ncbi:MAG: chromosome partition protein MukB, partial [Planctomycetes bacterium]|nr:chromosome partition protein MukB [Planctomycetota bacterium]